MLSTCDCVYEAVVAVVITPDATPALTFPNQHSSYSAVVTVYLAPVIAKLAPVIVSLALDTTPAPTFRAKLSVRFSVPINRDCVRNARESVPSTHKCVLSTRDSVFIGRDGVSTLMLVSRCHSSANLPQLAFSASDGLLLGPTEHPGMAWAMNKCLGSALCGTHHGRGGDRIHPENAFTSG